MIGSCRTHGSPSVPRRCPHSWQLWHSPSSSPTGLASSNSHSLSRRPPFKAHLPETIALAINTTKSTNSYGSGSHRYRTRADRRPPVPPPPVTGRMADGDSAALIRDFCGLQLLRSQISWNSLMMCFVGCTRKGATSNFRWINK
jgi:hypothetical protein